MLPFVGWLVGFFRSPAGSALAQEVGEEVVGEIAEVLAPADPPAPLSYADVKRQHDQAASAAHAFPPPIAEPLPPTPPPKKG